MAHKPAGGLGSRNVVSKPVRTGVGARAVNKNWPAQVGGSRGNKVMRKGQPLPGDMRADPYKGPSFKPVPLGNALVNNVGAGGPGAGRQVYKSGAQHGLASPEARSTERPILGSPPRTIFK